MTRTRTSLSRATLWCAGVLLALLVAPRHAALGQDGAQGGAPAAAAGQDRGGAGVDREAMWYPPTAEDWKKPCLIAWQRTWDDAVALSRETQRPILVCVNMDGEIASEHYAGVRYRDPAIAKLYEPYVCVIASTYRHTPRDYDEEGRRVECPRFGTVTCSEHIWLEPIVYEKFLDGRRIAPRHIMVELDGSETYDVFYAWDTDSVFAAIRNGIEQREGAPPFVERGDRSLVERVGSPDAADKQRVESAFRDGDAALRKQLLEQAARSGADASVDLLRLAVFGVDADLAREARAALTQANGDAAAELVNQALRAPLSKEEREALVAALERMGESAPRARLLGVVHRGLSTAKSSIDSATWAAAAQSATFGERGALEDALTAAGRALAEQDAATQLAYAEACLAIANEPSTARERRRVLALDARGALDRAAALGASGWRVDAARALVAHAFGERDAALAAAEAAVLALPEGAAEWNALAVLSLFEEGRRRAIERAVRRGEEWPASWLADVHAAHVVLARHPSATDARTTVHYDFLWRLGAHAEAAAVLDAGLARFPESFELHARLRGRLMFEQGPAGLEAEYTRRRAASQQPIETWYAGYASLVAAEYERRAARTEAADAAYSRSEELFAIAASTAPERKASADHYAALCLAGRARLALEARDLDRATALLVQSFERAPNAAASLDGLNLSPADTSRSLRARLEEAGRADLVATLDAALAALDPSLLGLPAYEFETPDPNQDRGREDR
jgi:hypothetical protein